MSKINRLDEIFEKRGITNRVIAKYVNKSEGTVSKWRRNKRQPPIEDLSKIAELLRINIKDCFYNSDWSTSKAPTYQQFKANAKLSDE